MSRIYRTLHRLFLRQRLPCRLTTESSFPCRPLSLGHRRTSFLGNGGQHALPCFYGNRFFASAAKSPATQALRGKRSVDEEEDVAFDWEYICDPRNMEEIRQNIVNRKGVGNIDVVLDLWRKLEKIKSQDLKLGSPEYKATRRSLIEAAFDLPNRSHPDVPIGDESKAIQVTLCGKQREFSFEPKPAEHLAEGLGILRTHDVGLATGPRTYYLKNDLALLEEALVSYALDILFEKGFSLISVPDLVPSDVIEGCGFKTTGLRTQVYKLKKERHGDICMAGTGEIPIAGYFKNTLLKLKDLPKRMCTVSRCYRAETSDVERERGLYRVHQFTKVEMFGVTENETGKEGGRLLNDILDIQQSIFDGLGFQFRTLNMPSQELGAPAVQKFDMETWLPARKFWGEISSASNCTDYQSRRLSIRYENDSGKRRHCHTVNGTAGAIPRLIISILENNQNQDGSVTIPPKLRPYLDNLEVLKRQSSVDCLQPMRRYHPGRLPNQ